MIAVQTTVTRHAAAHTGDANTVPRALVWARVLTLSPIVSVVAFAVSVLTLAEAVAVRGTANRIAVFPGPFGIAETLALVRERDIRMRMT